MKSLLLILLALFSVSVSAQVSVEKLDEKYTPPAESMFNSEDDDNFHGDDLMPYKHTLTLNTFMLFRNKVLLNYTYGINEYLHIVAGGGINPDKDNFRSQLSVVYDNYDNITSSSNVEYLGGFNINAGLRFPYYGLWETANNYFQLDYRMSSDRFSTTTETGGDYDWVTGTTSPIIEVTQESKLVEHQFSLLLGYHWQTKFGPDNFVLTHTMHYGLGYRTDLAGITDWDVSSGSHSIVGLLTYSIGFGILK